MNTKFKKQIIFCLFLLLSFLLLNQFAYAQETIVEEYNSANCKCAKTETLTPECKKYCGDYELDDAVIVFINISKIILGLTGSIALLAFVIGGTMFLISSGNKNLIEKGRSTIIGAVIGLIIVFASYTIIGFLLKVLAVKGSENWFAIGGLLGG